MLAHPHAPWTDLTLILDRSGSIADIRESLLAGINQFLAGQAKEAGHTRISLIRFDDQFETVWDRIPLSGATFLHSQDLVPRGRTALYDAIGLTLERTQEHLARLSPANRPAQVIVAVFTDGQENASRRFTRASLQDLISRCRNNDWQILFLASSLEALEDARDLGIDPKSSVRYENSAEGIMEAFACLHHDVSALRQSPSTPAPAPDAAPSSEPTMPGTARW